MHLEVEAARAEAERQRALADAEVEAGKKAEAEAAARKAEELEAQRRSELSELKTLQAENGPLVDQTVDSLPHTLTAVACTAYGYMCSVVSRLNSTNLECSALVTASTDRCSHCC